MNKAYSYVRFSTPDQLKGDSLRRQLEASERYAQEHGLVLDTSLRDLGISGFKGANAKEGALARFIALVESGEIKAGSVLIVESLDRLSREAVMKALPRFLDLIARGISIVTLGSSPQRYDEKSIEKEPFILFASLIEMVRANEESKRKSERVGAAWARKKREAGTKGPITKQCPFWLRVEGGRFVTIPERVAIVRRIFEESMKGKGKAIIAKRFNLEVVPAFSGDGWHPSYLHKILHNRAVIGEFQPMTKKDGVRIPDGQPVPDYFPRVIDDETFMAVTRAITKRKTTGGRPSDNNAALFTSLIKCAHCGGSVIHVTKNKAKKWVYLVCYNARRGQGCEYRSWLAHEFEEIFLKWIVDFNFSAKAPNKELLYLEKIVAGNEGKIDQIKQKVGNLINTLEITGSATVAARIKELEAEKMAAEKTLESSKIAYLDLREKADVAASGQEDFRAAIIDPEARGQLKQELKKRVKRMAMVFDASKDEVYADGRRFTRVSMVNGTTWDLFSDGESVEYKDGRQWVSNSSADEL